MHALIPMPSKLISVSKRATGKLGGWFGIPISVQQISYITRLDINFAKSKHKDPWNAHYTFYPSFYGSQ